MYAMIGLLAAAQPSALLLPTAAPQNPGRLLSMGAGGAGASSVAGSGVSAQRLAHGVWLLRVDEGQPLVRTGK